MSVNEPATAAPAADILTVSNGHELFLAIQTLSETGGGTIAVRNAGEDYRVNAYRMGHDTGVIRVVAEDPEDPPVFTELRLQDSHNFSFEGLTFDSSAVFKDRPGYIDDINVTSSHNVTIRDSTFRSVADGTFTGTGSATLGESLGKVYYSDNFAFIDNTVSHYFQGLSLRDTTNATISGNTFSHMQGDGIRLNGIKDSLIEGNTFESFFGTSQDVNHSDMIQLWSTDANDIVTDGLTIRGNVFNSVDGLAYQSIFLKNEWALSGNGPNYGTITIEDNVIHNGHVHGITVYNTDNAIVRNNTLLWDPEAVMYNSASATGANYQPEIRFYNVAGGEISGNVASRYLAPGFDLSDNVTVNYTLASAENHVSRHFVNVGNGGSVDLRDLEMLPDSPWAGLYGADMLKAPANGGAVVAVLQQAVDPSDPFLVTYSAALSRAGDGPIPDDATVRWHFPDGTVKKGMIVQHQLDTPGSHDVTLEVIVPGGATDSITRLTRIEDPVLLRLDFDGTVEDRSTYETPLAFSATAELVEGTSGTAFRLDGSTKVNIDRDIGHLHALDSFAISLDLRQLAEDADGGVFLHRHQSMTGEITKTGALKFSLATTEGWFTVTSDPGVVTADTWHELRISYNAVAGGLRLEVDGGTVAHATHIAGTLVNTHKQDLNIGNTWNASIMADVDNFMFLNSDTLSADRAGTHIAPLAFDPAFGAAPEPAPEPAPDIIGPLAAADLLLLDFDDGQIVDLSGHETRIATDGATLTDGVTGGGLWLDGTGMGDDVTILRGAEQIGMNDSLSLGVSLKQDGAAGIFMHMHRGLTFEVTDDGAVRFSLSTTEGWFTARSDAGLIQDDTWHRVLASFDDATDSLALYVDGEIAAEIEASGQALFRSDAHHINLGNTWQPSLRGQLDDLAMAGTALDAEAAARDYAAMIGQHDLLM